MSFHLLDMPPELISLILDHLPVKSLLKFAETSKHSRLLANANLRTLKLGIQPIRSRHGVNDTPDCVHVRIKSALRYDYSTLLNFHNALVQSILARYGNTLQTLDLSLWTLTTPIADAISKLPALRSLSIRLEDNIFARAVPRSCMAWERLEQDKAWKLLAKTAVWKQRLHSLKLENAEVTTEQLKALLQGSGRCESLHLNKCRYVDSEIWKFLGSESWSSRKVLRRLFLEESGGVLKEAAFKSIANLISLQYLNLYNCYGTCRQDVDTWNQDVWHIPHVELPASPSDTDVVLEVDPAYMIPILSTV